MLRAPGLRRLLSDSTLTGAGRVAIGFAFKLIVLMDGRVSGRIPCVPFAYSRLAKRRSRSLRARSSQEAGNDGIEVLGFTLIIDDIVAADGTRQEPPPPPHRLLLMKQASWHWLLQ